MAPKRSPYFLFTYQFRVVVAGLLVVVFASAGTAQAAQGALPGDLLYPIKININERVEVALAATPKTKANVEATIAQRRVQEALVLEEQGRLDATTTQEIEDNFNEHASAALALVPGAAMGIAPVSESGTPQFEQKKSLAPTSTRSTAVRTKTPPRAFSASSTAVLEASSSDTAMASSSINEQGQDEEEGVHIQASLEHQRDILEGLKLRVSEQRHGKQKVELDSLSD